jgi:glycosyltransferase involved in cell wall biosynthesis
MKILFISQYFYPETFKGNDLVFDLVKRGHEVTVLTAKPNYPEGKFYKGYGFFKKKSEIINGAKIIRIPIYPRRNGRGIHLIFNYLSFVFFSYFACIFRVKGQYDSIIVQQLSPVTVGMPGVWLKKRKKAKMYLWVLDLWPESFIALSKIDNKIIINFVIKIVKYIYNNTDVFFVSSKSFELSIINYLDIKKPIYYLPNWAEETDTIEIDTSKLPLFPKGFNILFAGNLGDSQGLSDVLKAAKVANDINWIFVGDGRFSQIFKSQIQSEKLTNVFVFGRFPVETMGYFYKNADVLLVSLSKDPVFSMTVPAKIQSYMAHGKVILGILDGEGRELINKSGIGVAVNAGDWLTLSQKAQYLKSLTKNQKITMEKKSREEYINNFSKNQIINQIEEILLNRKLE